MRPALIIAATFAATLVQASAVETVIGVAAPLSGPSALLGEQLRTGAAAGARAIGIRLEIADDSCTAEGGANAARTFVAARVSLVTGFLCTEAIEAALPILKEAGIAVIATGVRTNSLTDRRSKTGWPVVRFAPRADDEVEAASAILGRAWRDELFAIVDDGTIYGRELAEGFRLAAEQAGLKPVFTDTFRPQLENQIALAGRLRKSGATHVLAGGDRADLAILGRDARELGYDLVIAGGEALRAARDSVDLATGTLMIAPADWAATADPAVLSQLTQREILPAGYVLPSYAAVEIALQALKMTADGSVPVTSALSNDTFQTVLGPVRFDVKGDWIGEHYRLFRYDGSAFQPMD